MTRFSSRLGEGCRSVNGPCELSFMLARVWYPHPYEDDMLCCAIRDCYMGKLGEKRRSAIQIVNATQIHVFASTVPGWVEVTFRRVPLILHAMTLAVPQDPSHPVCHGCRKKKKKSGSAIERVGHPARNMYSYVLCSADRLGSNSYDIQSQRVS